MCGFCSVVASIPLSGSAHAQVPIFLAPVLESLAEGTVARIAVGTAAREIAAEAGGTAISEAVGSTVARGAAVEARAAARGLADSAKLEVNASRTLGSSGSTRVGVKMTVDAGAVASALAPSFKQSQVPQASSSMSSYDCGSVSSAGSFPRQPAASATYSNDILQEPRGVFYPSQSAPPLTYYPPQPAPVPTYYSPQAVPVPTYYHRLQTPYLQPHGYQSWAPGYGVNSNWGAHRGFGYPRRG